MLDAQGYYSMRRPRLPRWLVKLVMLGMIAAGAVDVVKHYF